MLRKNCSDSELLEKLNALLKINRELHLALSRCKIDLESALETIDLVYKRISLPE